MLFRDMARAGRAHRRARSARGERIGIYGDYDVDGRQRQRAAGALPAQPSARASCSYIPHRLRDGYGLNAGGVAAARRGRARA